MAGRSSGRTRRDRHHGSLFPRSAVYPVCDGRYSCHVAEPVFLRASAPDARTRRGPSNDFVVAPDGRMINSLALIYSVRDVEGIESFRVRQQAVDRFHMQLVRNANYPGNAEARIAQAWRQLLRTPVTVTFEYVPVLAAEPSGKFRHVISEVAIGGQACHR